MDFKRFWYQATKYWPRPIPETPEDFEKLKQILQLYFDTPDTNVGWISVASEIQNTRTKFLRKPLYLYANVVRKIEINGMAENQKRLEGKKLSDKLKEATEKVVHESMPTPDSEADLPLMQGSERAVGTDVTQ